MSKVPSSRATSRFDPLHQKAIVGEVKRRTFGFIIYDAGTISKKEKLPPFPVAMPSTDRVSDDGKHPTSPLTGRQWLSQKPQSYRELFLQQFAVPAGTVAYSRNAWPAFQSFATKKIQELQCKRFIKANEIWIIIQEDRVDIAEGWKRLTKNATENHTERKLPCMNKGGATGKQTRVSLGSPSQARLDPQTPSTGSSMLSTPSLQAGSWSSTPAYFGSPGPDWEVGGAEFEVAASSIHAPLRHNRMDLQASSRPNHGWALLQSLDIPAYHYPYLSPPSATSPHLAFPGSAARSPQQEVSYHSVDGYPSASSQLTYQHPATRYQGPHQFQDDSISKMQTKEDIRAWDSYRNQPLRYYLPSRLEHIHSTPGSSPAQTTQLAEPIELFNPAQPDISQTTYTHPSARSPLAPLIHLGSEPISPASEIVGAISSWPAACPVFEPSDVYSEILHQPSIQTGPAVESPSTSLNAALKPQSTFDIGENNLDLEFLRYLPKVGIDISECVTTGDASLGHQPSKFFEDPVNSSFQSGSTFEGLGFSPQGDVELGSTFGLGLGLDFPWAYI